MNLFWWKEKPLRTVWRVEKDGHTSFLVGTAHFSPYRFKKTLTKLIQGVETVLFEGPLDEESMARVVQYGQQGENTPSLYEALHPDAIVEINKLLSARSEPPNHGGSLSGPHPSDDFRFFGNPYAGGPSLDGLLHHLVRLFELETFDGCGSLPHRPEAWEKDRIS